MRPRPEPVGAVKQRRDAALNALVGRVPLITFMGIQFDRRGDELTAVTAVRRKADRQPVSAGIAWRGDQPPFWRPRRLSNWGSR